MGLKKIDNRIRIQIENGVATGKRSMIVLVGDKGRDQVVNLHAMLSKARVKARPSVLWCYKKELGFSSNKKKRMRELKKKMQRGNYKPDDEPFELFVTSTKIRWAFYHETPHILGQTYGVCVLQDFEAITPNVLARTIETVEGGGLVILLLKTMNSLKQLYSMSMDVHSRYRTSSRLDVKPRFNERFLLSLGDCSHCLVLDDTLNMLPISSHAYKVKPVSDEEKIQASGVKGKSELDSLIQSLQDSQPMGSLVSKTKTMDQAKAVLSFIEAVSEKTLRSTVALTAARGRGKSAALGLAIASAIAFEYSNIFVTSPSPENLKTLFEFVCVGFDALGYQEHMDYELIQSTDPSLHKAVVRVNVFHVHRQTIQYIAPQDANPMLLAQTELLVIDEAAAIPLTFVEKMMGPYLVFMSSTINGYEGTGRSLSLKLIKKLRDQQHMSLGPVTAQTSKTSKEGGHTHGIGIGSGATLQQASSGGRVLREITLQEPIRYSKGDPIEAWLNNLLCLEATVAPVAKSGCPMPRDCELFYVNKDTLFSYHKASEAFLQQMMALYVASHYRNSPNDLQMMSDAPAHHLFVLLGPLDDHEGLPDILCVMQVCLEGGIAREIVKKQMGRGERGSGDLIPWSLAQQFQDDDFASLNGARVVRIATHPDYVGMGYGGRALSLLTSYYEGELTGVFADKDSDDDMHDKEKEKEKGSSMDSHSMDSHSNDSLLHEHLAPRKSLPPLFERLSERRPEPLHYLGVAYGITKQLYQFWNRGGFRPCYIRQSANEITGEHTCIMVRNLEHAAPIDSNMTLAANWLDTFHGDFCRRFAYLLGFEFRSLDASLSLALLSNGIGESKAGKVLDDEIVNFHFTPSDILRLEKYANNLVDYHLILDLVPRLATLFFDGYFGFSLSKFQSAILMGIGLQRKTVDTICKEIDSPSRSLLAMFNKAMRKFSAFFRNRESKAVAATIPSGKDVVLAVDGQDLDPEFDRELEERGRMVEAELRAKHQKMSVLNEYAVGGDEEEWNKALEGGEGVPSVISVKRKSKGEPKEKEKEKERKKHGSKSKKRKSSADGEKKKKKRKKQE